MKNKNGIIKAISFLMLWLFFVAGAYAQQTVTGKVSDADGTPLIGATVLIKGTSTGAITDFDGNYSISVPQDAKTLVFSYTGYADQEIEVGNQSVINVNLTEGIGLEEVVVVGYGTQKKTTVTGAVTQVKGDELMKGKATGNAALALQGEMPGLVVTRTSSRPGNEGLDIKIRGDISVNGSDPLIMLDGLEIAQWQLSTINPNDIESISVLKDGSAAIFGTKAAAGVILITTKKGQAGKMKVEYTGDVQFNYAYDYPTSNLKELAQTWLLGGRNDMIDYLDADGVEQTAGFTGRFFTEDEWQMMVDGTFPMAPESYFFSNRDHRFTDIRQYDLIYGTTMSHRHNVAVSGGNDKATYRTSLGYSNDRSPMEFAYDGAKRLNFQTNVSYKLTDMISTEIKVGYDNRFIDAPNQGVGESIGNFEAYPKYNPDGQYYGLWNNNILAKLDEGGRNTNEQEAFRFGGTIKLDLDKYVNGLSFKYNANITKRSSLSKKRRTQYTLYDWDGNVEKISPAQSGTYIDIDESRIAFQNHVLQGNYDFSLGRNNIGLMLGTVAELKQTNNFGLYRKGLASNELDDINTGDATTWKNNGGSNAVGLVSYIARVNYDFDGIFLLEGLGRRDGSSRLDPEFRWKNFFSGLAAIRFTEFGFMKSNNLFDDLKLRVSYGETGSVTGIGAYDYVSGISNSSTYFGVTPGFYNTAYISSLVTTDRTWERVANSNIGLDFSILKGKLSGYFELFHRQNNDMLIAITYPDILGASAPKTNSGDFNTNGWELMLNWRDKVGEIGYSVGLAFWNSESEVTRMEGATVIKRGRNSYIEGYPLQSLFVYETDGYLQNEQEVLAYYEQLGFDNSEAQTMKSGTNLPVYRSADRLIPGSVRRVDVNGDGVISEDDLVFYGDENPHYSANINLGLEWKGFDLSAFFQGVANQNILRTGTLGYPFRRWWNNQNNTFIGASWTPDNTDAQFPIVCYNGKRKSWNYSHPNDINVIKASYLRAKVISIGYTLPATVLNKIGMGKTRISVSGNDLFVISNVKDGLDPEADNDQTNGDIYPYNTSVVFSIQATF